MDYKASIPLLMEVAGIFSDDTEVPWTKKLWRNKEAIGGTLLGLYLIGAASEGSFGDSTPDVSTSADSGVQTQAERLAKALSRKDAERLIQSLEKGGETATDLQKSIMDAEASTADIVKSGKDMATGMPKPWHFAATAAGSTAAAVGVQSLALMKSKQQAVETYYMNHGKCPAGYHRSDAKNRCLKTKG